MNDPSTPMGVVTAWWVDINDIDLDTMKFRPRFGEGVLSPATMVSLIAPSWGGEWEGAHRQPPTQVTVGRSGAVVGGRRPASGFDAEVLLVYLVGADLVGLAGVDYLAPAEDVDRLGQLESFLHVLLHHHQGHP